MKIIKISKINVSYTGVVSPESINNGVLTPWGTLLKNFQIPDGWTVHANHMTLNMGECKNKDIVGKEIKLKIVGIGKDENAMALLINTVIPSGNLKPHITLATSPGSKPQQSNDIVEWEPLEQSISIIGVVAEIGNGGTIITNEQREQERLQEDQRQQAKKEKDDHKEQEKQKLQQMGIERAKTYLQKQFPHLPEKAILGKLRGAGLL